MKRVIFFSLIMTLYAQICFGAGAGRNSGKPDGEFELSPPVMQQIQAAVQAPEVVKPNNPAVTGVELRPQVEIVRAESIKTISYGRNKIPTDYREIAILGKAVVSREQALDYLRRNVLAPKLSCSLKEIVDAYYEEAGQEGIRADLALCQALLETGMFSFRGTVYPDQNNFCGLGTTGKGVKGARFATARDGVRAHIQHLLAYCSRNMPKNRVVDPRYSLVHKIRLERGMITRWYGLNGTWAMGANYCEKIMTIYVEMLE